MEILKDDEIFSIIDTHYSLIQENNSECLIKLSNSSEWGENEFANFINVMKTEKYEETIEKQKLQVMTEDVILEISDSSNILKYSHNPNYIDYKDKDKSASFYKYKVLAKHKYNELFNSELQFKTVAKKLVGKENLPDNWNDIRKFFKINKRIVYTDKKTNMRFIVNICKCNKYDIEEADDRDLYYKLANSKIIKSSDN